MQSILGNSRKPDIVFSSSGRIDITSNVARHLHLRRGDVVDILSDGYEYYLYVKLRAPVGGRHEAMVFPTNSRGNHFRASSRKLCAAILEASGENDKARLCIGVPVEDNLHGILLPIIIKYLL